MGYEKYIIHEGEGPVNYRQPYSKRYSFGKFLGDCFMTLITSGLWIIWIFVREMRNH